MKLLALAFLTALAATPLSAQMRPQPEEGIERIQRVQFTSGQQVMLTMLPKTPLTVILEPGDEITAVQPGPEGGISVRVSAERDSFVVLPVRDDVRTSLAVTTRKREYQFLLKVDWGDEAALVVRYDYGRQSEPTPVQPQLEDTGERWRYRLRGDRSVSPANIVDDGIKTHITYTEGQALPAVFAKGPTGEEEVVNGYMRGDAFVIDRVYGELVFRIDKKKATARRNSEPEQPS